MLRGSRVRSQSLFFVVLFFALSVGAQQGGSVAIPLKTIKKPAADLVGSNGQVLDIGEATSLAQKGYDLSLLNPQEGRLWQNQKYTGEEITNEYYPSSEQGVQWLSTEASRPQVFSHLSRVAGVKNGNSFFRLTISRYAHDTLMRAALLRKLGYYVPTPRYYKRLRVFFKSEEQKTEFITEVNQEVVTDLKDRGWIVEDNEKNHSILMNDILLEAANPDYYDIANGSAPDPDFARAALQRLSRYRPFRALILPFTLVDIPESVNRYSPKIGSVLAGHIIFSYPYASSFAAATYEDVRWLGRRLMTLTEQDLREVVLAGKFPAELNELIYAKLIHRIYNSAEMFDLKTDFHFQLPNLFVNSSGGLVKNGKVTREKVEGFPYRFAHGDRESPFRDGDFARYLNIRGKSSLLSTALGELNKKLQFLKLEDVATNHQKDITNKIIEHIKNHPNEPLYQKVESWGGPVGGFNFAATRDVATGTYYDSTAPIQLVDDVSVSVSLGYFMALDGYPKMTPTGGANVSLMRDYTHVRPILSMEEGGKVSWKNLIVPQFMKNLAAVLDKEKVEDIEDGAKVERHSIDKFLGELKDGEVFTITDSIVTTAYAQVASSLDVLLGISPMSFLNSASLGVDANRVILRQTSIIKTAGGLQIFVRNQSGNILGMTLDVNYLINVLRIRAQTNITDLKTDAFVIKYNSFLSSQADGEGEESELGKEVRETRQNLRVALSALFRHNETDLLYTHFKYQKFDIDHKLKTKEMRNKFLLFRSSSFTEDHWATILYPRSEEAPELKPEDEKVVLFSNKKGELVGRDLLGLGAELIEGVINKKSKVKVTLNQTTDPNPANTPFGKAYWRVANTEADFSPNGERYPRVALLSHVWGGWKIERKDFFNLLDEITQQFQNTPIGSYRLIEKEAFMNVKSVDFYRINALLSVLPKGLDRVRDLILQPQAKDKKQEKAKWLSGLFQKLSKKLGNGARPQEMEMYSEIVRILGNDNKAVGEAIYRRACEDSFRDNEGGVPATTGTWRNGNYYECLAPWMDQLMQLSAKYPANDETAQVRWTTQVLYVLDQYIPMAQMLKYLGEENFIFTVRMNGFRTGDEDADLEYFSNSIGDPRENIDYANGLFQMYANKTGILSIELDRTQGGFR